MEPVPTSTHKVTVVGVGNVGMACAISILAKVSFFLIFLLIYIYIYTFKIEKSFARISIAEYFERLGAGRYARGQTEGRDVGSTAWQFILEERKNQREHGLLCHGEFERVHSDSRCSSKGRRDEARSRSKKYRYFQKDYSRVGEI